jgi:regulator of sirC expression with transglutaminase-like and TPR domain
MLRNLEAIHRGNEDWSRLLAVQQRLVVLQPRDWDWRRDRGLTYAQLGHTDAAIDDLSSYLHHAPGASDRGAIAAQLQALRGSRPPSWH